MKMNESEHMTNGDTSGHVSKVDDGVHSLLPGVT